MDNNEADLPIEYDNMFIDDFFTKYVIGVTIALIAVLMAYYCSNYIKTKSEKQLQEAIEQSGKTPMEANVGDISQVEKALTLKHNESIMDNDDCRNEYKIDESVRSVKSSGKIERKLNEKGEQLMENKTTEQEVAPTCKLLEKQESQLDGHGSRNESDDNDDKNDEDLYNCYDDESDRIYNPGLVRSLHSLQKLEARLKTQNSLTKKQGVQQEQMAFNNKTHIDDRDGGRNESDDNDDDKNDEDLYNCYDDESDRIYNPGLVRSLHSLQKLEARLKTQNSLTKKQGVQQEQMAFNNKTHIDDQDGGRNESDDNDDDKNDEDLYNCYDDESDRIYNPGLVRSLHSLQKLEARLKTQNSLTKKQGVQQEQIAFNNKTHIDDRDGGRNESDDNDDDKNDEDLYNCYDDESDRTYNPGLVRSLHSLQKLEARLKTQNSLTKKQGFEQEQIAFNTETQIDDQESSRNGDKKIGHNCHKVDGNKSNLMCHPGLARSYKKLEMNLTEDQLAEERRVEREQMAAILELLKKQESQLNVEEIDEKELNAQLNLYR